MKHAFWLYLMGRLEALEASGDFPELIEPVPEDYTLLDTQLTDVGLRAMKTLFDQLQVEMNDAKDGKFVARDDHLGDYEQYCRQVMFYNLFRNFFLVALADTFPELWGKKHIVLGVGWRIGWKKDPVTVESFLAAISQVEAERRAEERLLQ